MQTALHQERGTGEGRAEGHRARSILGLQHPNSLLVTLEILRAMGEMSQEAQWKAASIFVHNHTHTLLTGIYFILLFRIE